MQVAFGSSQQNPTVIRNTCTALQNLDPTSINPQMQLEVTRRLAGVILDGLMPASGWYSAAEAAIKAVFALHPAPAAVGMFALRTRASAVFEGIFTLDQSVPFSLLISVSAFRVENLQGLKLLTSLRGL